MSDLGTAVVVWGLLAGVIAFAWRIAPSTSEDPKMTFLNTLMRHAAHRPRRANSR